VDLKNEPVTHPVFGTGIVIFQDKKRITIEFPGETGIKHFLYPDAFEKYLTMSNSSAAKKVLADLAAKKSKMEAQLQAEEETAQKLNAILETAAQKRKSLPKAKPPKSKSKK